MLGLPWYIHLCSDVAAVRITPMKELIVFASGTATGGGSGFANLIESNLLKRGTVVKVISNHKNGGVQKHAERLGIPFVHFAGSYTSEEYQLLVNNTDYVALSGWLKPVRGLDPCTTFNIHPGPLPRFGGKGMYGHHIHEAVIEAYRAGEVTHGAITMHFVTDFDTHSNDGYDKGPVFFEKEIAILEDDTAESLGKRVNEAEHKWQPVVTYQVLAGEIYWDGKNNDTIVSPYKDTHGS